VKLVKRLPQLPERERMQTKPKVSAPVPEKPKTIQAWTQRYGRKSA
jgi:hypothetical protein